MSEKKQAEIIPVGTKGTVVINPGEQEVIDLSNGAAGINKDLVNAGGTGGAVQHRGAPPHQRDGYTKRRKKKKRSKK